MFKQELFTLGSSGIFLEQKSAFNSYKKQYENEEEKKVAKMRKMIKKMKTNIGQFHNENTIGDLLPYNQKLIVLNHEMTIS